jgi:hypothetical protein
MIKKSEHVEKLFDLSVWLAVVTGEGGASNASSMGTRHLLQVDGGYLIN